MENKNILLIAAAVAAYFVLGGKDLLSGGASGGGGSKESKSTAITGIVPEQPGYFTPSPQSINPPAYTPTQEYQPTDKMWNDVLRVRDTPFGTSKKEIFMPQYISSTNPNMYSSYSSSEANYLTKTVGLTPADPSRGAYDVLPAGFKHAEPAPVTKKESSSSSSSSSSSGAQNYSNQGGGTYSNSGFGGWG